jgi:hypothetical protein
MNRLVQKKYDVAVIGGGPGGLPAAIAAARMGSKVVLVERNAFLGGAAASGLGILGYIDRHGNPALGGIAQEIINRLTEIGGALGHYRCPVHNSITPISPDLFKIIAVEMCEQAGVDILFNNELLDVQVDNGKITNVTVYGKCTRTNIKADIFIDGTGDGDLAYMAGANYITGQDGTGVMQPCTLMFTVSDFDLEKLFSYAEENPEDFGIKEEYADGYNLDFFRNTKGHCFIGLQNLIKQAKENGEFDVPRNQFIYITTPSDKLLAVNTTRLINTNAADPFELSNGLVTGYKQVLQLIKFMNKYVPGFENAKLSQIAPSLGVRETRHFEGIERLTVENMYTEKTNENAIALCAYNIDIHSGTSDTIDLTLVEKAFGIPYGCLVPKHIEGLLLSGRTISVDSSVFAATRVMGPCIAIGEAAGIAAALSVKTQTPVAKLAVADIREILIKNGAIL